LGAFQTGTLNSDPLDLIHKLNIQLMNTIFPSWLQPPDNLILDKNDVHVWIASLDNLVISTQEFANVLSKDELRKADRFVFERDKSRFINGRGILRTIIGNYYLSIQPHQLKFHYGFHGKPYLAECSGSKTLRYNRSDSNGLALYAFSKNLDVGIDFEHMRELDDAKQIVDGSFSEYEKAVYSALPAREKFEAFFKCWTRKEAFIKAVGEGLYYPLDQFDVSFSPSEPPRILSIGGNRAEASEWTLIDFKPRPGYSAALAFKGLPGELIFFKFL